MLPAGYVGSLENESYPTSEEEEEEAEEEESGDCHVTHVMQIWHFILHVHQDAVRVYINCFEFCTYT
jgi:hypothetical protein